jgi:hypothetical protein
MINHLKVAQRVITEAQKRSIEIANIAPFYAGAAQVNEPIQSLKSSDSRIIVLLCDGVDFPMVMRSANAVGMIGGL